MPTELSRAKNEITYAIWICTTTLVIFIGAMTIVQVFAVRSRITDLEKKIDALTPTAAQPAEKKE